MSGSAKADTLALALVEHAENPEMVRHIAARLALLAADLRQQENAAVPEHPRTVPDDLPRGVVKLCGRRTRL